MKTTNCSILKIDGFINQSMEYLHNQIAFLGLYFFRAALIHSYKIQNHFNFIKILFNQVEFEYIKVEGNANSILQSRFKLLC